MDISMDIHEKSVDMDMDAIFHIHGNPDIALILLTRDEIYNSRDFQSRCNQGPNEKSTYLERRKKIRPVADLPGGSRRPKFNQLEMVTTFTYKPSLVRIDARNFELSR